ncbi:MAG: oligosaccharide repeat unit polymerase [Endozoicomonas sp. (ex Botrylloides leachii)]|nr:oligosaccharide repeat unit polymerase [Endozoicomonas sp. (ex Botrylloides leachii)]
MKTIWFLVFWWLVFSFGAAYLDTGLDPVSDKVVILVIIFLSSMVLGALLRGGNNSGVGHENVSYVIVARTVGLILLFLFLFQLPVWIYLVEKLFQGYSLANIRKNLFIGSEISQINKILYGYSYSVFYNILLVSSFAFFYCYKKKSFLLFSIFFIAISGYLKGSRAEVYQFLLVGFIYLFSVDFKLMYQTVKRYWLYVLFALLVLFLLVYWISISRGGDFFHEVVKYHSVGFVLLSKSINGQIGMLDNDFNYGIAFFGGIDFLIGLIARFLFWEDFQTHTRAVLDLQNVSTPTQTFTAIVSPSMESYSLTGHNAFYTLMITGYQSFGVYGCMLLGLLLGFLIRHLIIESVNKGLASNFYLIMSITVVSMGIFSSALETVGFWLTMIALNVIMALIFFHPKGSQDLVG